MARPSVEDVGQLSLLIFFAVSPHRHCTPEIGSVVTPLTDFGLLAVAMFVDKTYSLGYNQDMDNKEGSAENADQGHEQEQEVASADNVSLKMLTLLSKRCPFEDWYKGFRDAPTRQRIRARLSRLTTGNFGDFKPVGGEVYEIRLDFGPGYRIYFARVGETIVVLLGGGDKSTQQKDIDRAIEMWKEHKNDAERFQSNFPG